MEESDRQIALILQEKLDCDTRNDYEIAQQLQQTFQQECDIERPNNGLVYTKNPKRQETLVDPSWEIIDPTPDVHNLFIVFDKQFFWNKLNAVTVSWRSRMTRCAGICTYNGGYVSITLSEPLLKLRPRKDLVETLLHEMIHAYLFVTKNNRDREGHGPEFHKHMYRINREAGTNITVYHNFHDEVDFYLRHVWRCNGPCRGWKPYFGTVKRSINRAPGPNDRWWASHQFSCGGEFIKIQEPQKNTTKNKAAGKNERKKDQSDIRNYISVDGNITNSNIMEISSVLSSNDVVFKNNNMFDILTVNNNISVKSNTVVNNGMLVPFANINSFNNLYSQNSQISKKTLNNQISTTNNNKTTINGILKPKENSAHSDILNSTITLNETSRNVEDDYSVVRNHWLNKFTTVNQSNNKTALHKSQTDGQIVDSKIENNSKNSLQSNIPNGLFNINNKRLSSSEMDEAPKMKIAKQSCDNSILVTCPVCFKNFLENIINTHLDECLLQDDIVNMEQCPICEKYVEVKAYDSHYKECSNGLSDNDLEKLWNFSNCNTITSEMTSCLVCGKEISKCDLYSHLDECEMRMMSTNQSKTTKTEETGFNCPLCFKLLPENELKSHVNACIEEGQFFENDF